MGAFSIRFGSFDIGSKSVDNDKQSLKSSPSSTSLASTSSSTSSASFSSFSSIASSSSSLSLRCVRDAGKAKLQSMISGASTPQEKMLKELKKDTHKMLMASTSSKNIDAVVSTMEYGIGRSLESAISDMQKEAKGSGRLRNMATNLQNLVTMRDLAQQTGRPLTGKMKAFADEAAALLNEPVNNGGRSIPFSAWATTATYKEGPLQSGWEPVAMANMRDHMEKIQDFAKRYNAHQNPLSFSGGIDSGSYLKKMQQGMRRLTQSSDEAPPKPARRDSAPGRMQSAANYTAADFAAATQFESFVPQEPARRDSAPGRMQSAPHYTPADFAAATQFESFAPHTPAMPPRQNSAPARMEQHAAQQHSPAGGPSFAPFYTASPASSRPATPHQETPAPMSGADLRRRSAISMPTRNQTQQATHQYFQAKTNTMLSSVSENPGAPGNFDAFLRLETEFENHELNMHPRDRNSIREALGNIYQQIAPYVPG